MKKLIQGCGLALLGLFIGAFVDLPVLAQVVVNPGGGSSSITLGTTQISGGATTQILYNLSGVVSSDSGFTRSGVNGTTTIDNGSGAVSILVLEDNNNPILTVADGGAITALGQLTMQGNGIVVPVDQKIQLGGTQAQGGSFYFLSTPTPDSPVMLSGTLSNSWNLYEFGDIAFDFANGACGTAACTDPGLIIHSAVQDTTQYNHLANWGQAGGAIKTLTESAATVVVRIPVAALDGTGGKLFYRVKAADATDVQIREGGGLTFAVVNKAGTETCTLSAAAETTDGSVIAASVGTLTYAITCDTTPTNAVDISFNAVSSLTQTTLNIQYFVVLTGAGQPARQ